MELPHLKQLGSTWQLCVDNKPFLILGGQVQNSTMSSAEYMRTLWPKLVDMGINTVLGAVSWEAIEPEEGVFDFAELDAILADARAHNLRMVILWFGSFKNGMSTYVPWWVKKNHTRFPRMKISNPKGTLRTLEAISIFDPNCVDADIRAFTALLRHLKDIDSQRTVIMVQIQNEVGVVGDSRDRSQTADIIFQAPVPQQLVDFLVREWNRSLRSDLKANFPAFDSTMAESRGNWEACFGQSDRTDELFMSYHYALYLDKIAAAGKQEYPLPFFANVWLPKPGPASVMAGIVAGGNRPGIYPSGGAVSNVLDVWARFTPSLDFICPDIYMSDYTAASATYGTRDQAFFIPEQRSDAFGSRRICQAFGNFKAIGTSPFGVDTIQLEDCAFAKLYTLLRSVSTYILAAQVQPDSVFGFFFDELDSEAVEPNLAVKRRFGEYELAISRAFVFGKPGPGCGIVIKLAPGKFLLVGMGYRVEFKSVSPTSEFTGILRFLEKSVVDADNGTLKTERTLNGDETRDGKWCNMPNVKPDYGDQFIPACIPARTMLAEVEVYSLECNDAP